MEILLQRRRERPAVLELAERGGAGATAQDLPDVASCTIQGACVSSMEEAGLLLHHHDLHGDW